MLCDVAYVMQLEQIERRLAPVAAGLARAAKPELFEHALTLVDRALDEFKRDLNGDTEASGPVTGLDALYKEAEAGYA